jgi:hypothetical protein
MQNRVCELNRIKALTDKIEDHVTGVTSYMAYHHEIEMIKLVSRIKRQDLNIAEISIVIANSPLKYYTFFSEDGGHEWCAFSSLINGFDVFKEKHQNNIFPTLSKDKAELVSFKLKGHCEMWCRKVFFIDVNQVDYA